MHPGQRKSFPEGSRVIRQAGAASHVEGSHHGVRLMIKAGMWQAGTRLDLSEELLVKFHRAFSALIAGSLGYLWTHATGCSPLAAHSLGALIHLGERTKESAHTRHKTNAWEDGSVLQYSVCCEFVQGVWCFSFQGESL